MEVIRILTEKCHMQCRARKALQMYGASNEDMLPQPLATMPSEQVTRLVLKWQMINAKNGHQLELRISESEEQIFTQAQ